MNALQTKTTIYSYVMQKLYRHVSARLSSFTGCYRTKYSGYIFPLAELCNTEQYTRMYKFSTRLLVHISSRTHRPLLSVPQRFTHFAPGVMLYT